MRRPIVSDEEAKQHLLAIAEGLLSRREAALVEAARAALKELEWLRQDSMSAGPENALRDALKAYD